MRRSLSLFLGVLLVLVGALVGVAPATADTSDSAAEVSATTTSPPAEEAEPEPEVTKAPDPGPTEAPDPEPTKAPDTKPTKAAEAPKPATATTTSAPPRALPKAEIAFRCLADETVEVTVTLTVPAGGSAVTYQIYVDGEYDHDERVSPNTVETDVFIIPEGVETRVVTVGVGYDELARQVIDCATETTPPSTATVVAVCLTEGGAEVTVTLSVTGSVGEQTFQILVDGVLHTERTVPAGDSEDVEFTLDEDTGTRVVTVTANGSEKARTEVDTDCTESTATPPTASAQIEGVCVEGGGANVTVTLNVVGPPGTEAIFEILVDGVERSTHTVPAGDSLDVPLTFPEDSGTPTVTVTSGGTELAEEQVDTDCSDATTPPPTPTATAEIEGVCVVGGGANVTVTLNVVGPPGTEAIFEILVDNVQRSTHTVPAGDSLDVPLTFPEDSGTPTVTVTSGGTELAEEQVNTSCEDTDIDKTAVPAEGTPVQAPEQVIYRVKVSNSSDLQSATGDVVDTLPAGVIVVGPISDGGVLSADEKTITWEDVSLAAGAERTFTFTVRVLAGFGIPTLLNESTWLGKSDQTIHPVKAVNATVTAYCRGDTPFYRVRVQSQNLGPLNEDGDPHTVTVAWYQATADGEPIIVDGALVPAFDPDTGEQYVDVYPLVDGSLDTGELLWKGAAVDADGNPIDWPGYDFIDGEWVSVPDGGVRPASLIKVTVNPTDFDTAVYPPATPTCNANPPENPPNNPPGDDDELPPTGGNLGPQLALALLALVSGAALKGGTLLARR